MQNTFEITSCEVCGNHKLIPVLNLGAHPMCDDLIPVGDERVCKEYPIEILFCETCVTAHQRFQVPKCDLFPNTYHYRSRFTADVLSGMAALVDTCETRLKSIKNLTVLDIGCNDGSLLDFFKEKGGKTIGVEPTGAATDAEKKGHHVYPHFFSTETAEKILTEHGQPDIITFTNVFAHIENLPEIINALKMLMSERSMLVVENHYLGAVLSRNQFDTFYHEHPRNYSYTSFLYIAKNLGKKLQSVQFPSRYGGNIRVFIGGPTVLTDDQTQNEKILNEEKTFLNQFEILKMNIQKWQSAKGNFIQLLRKNNTKLPGKAFPGRAAILIKMLGIDETVISAVYEKPGSMKLGHYIPGTRIPIISDDQLFANDTNKETDIVNFAWHISNEIREYLNANGYQGKVIDILTSEDFSNVSEELLEAYA